jgi:hypothetical protein
MRWVDISTEPDVRVQADRSALRRETVMAARGVELWIGSGIVALLGGCGDGARLPVAGAPAVDSAAGTAGSGRGRSPAGGAQGKPNTPGPRTAGGGTSSSGAPGLDVVVSRATGGRLCPGDCEEISAEVTGGSGDHRVRWDHDLPEGPGPHRVCPRADTTYTATVEDSGGQSGSSQSSSVEIATDDAQCTPGRELCSYRVPVPDGVPWGDSGNGLGASLAAGDLGGLVRVDHDGNAVFAMGSAGVKTHVEENNAVAFAEVVVGKLDQDCELIWIRHFREEDGSGGLWPLGLVTDSASGVVLTGTLHGRVDFGDGVRDGQSAGSFAVKLDAGGEFVWVETFGPAYDDTPGGTYPYPRYGAEAAIGPADELIVFGETIDTTLTDPAALADARESIYVRGTLSGLARRYMTKLDVMSGAREWTRLFEDTGFVESIAIDGAGALVLGASNGFEWGDGTETKGAHLVVKLDADTRRIWSTVLQPLSERGDLRFGGDDWNWNHRLAIDSADDILYLGQGDDGEIPNIIQFSEDPGPWWLTKLSADGQLMWSPQRAAWTAGMPVAIAVDADLEAVVAGHFASTLDFGTGELTALGERDGFVIKLDAAGGLVWSQRYGASEGDWFGAVAVDDERNLWVSGWSGETKPMSWNGQPPKTLAIRSSNFITKLAP